MLRILKSFRKIAVFIIGIAIFGLGITLIPLPGPGLVVSFIGLLILSTEFEWAAKHRDKAKDEIQKIINRAKEKQNDISKKGE